jgi:hypothetical protein
VKLLKPAMSERKESNCYMKIHSDFIISHYFVRGYMYIIPYVILYNKSQETRLGNLNNARPTLLGRVAADKSIAKSLLYARTSCSTHVKRVQPS